MALYNSFQYNQINFNGFTLSDQVNLSDATVTKSVEPMVSDTLFVDDTLTINVANKALNDTIKLADWTSQKQNPQSDNWGD